MLEKPEVPEDEGIRFIRGQKGIGCLVVGQRIEPFFLGNGVLEIVFPGLGLA